jgi:hypothetical protein
MRKDLLGRGLSVTDVRAQLLGSTACPESNTGSVRPTVLDRIAEKEQTQVTEEDLERQFVLMARMWRVDPQKLFEHLDRAGWAVCGRHPPGQGAPQLGCSRKPRGTKTPSVRPRKPLAPRRDRTDDAAKETEKAQ